MTREEFLELIARTDPIERVEAWLNSDEVAACNSAGDYAAFQEQVLAFYPTATEIRIVGSGNWGYSLNPDKRYKRFDASSDIDVAIIDEATFELVWDELREYHRQSYYSLDGLQRDRLKRNGTNVYSGFVSPYWIGDRANKVRYNYLRNCQSLSSPIVQSLPVGMLFFRNRVEAVDYYRRGVMNARQSLKG